VAGVAVGGSFDEVGVVPGSFDDARAGSVSAWWVGLSPDFVEGVGDRVVKVFRG
jgi:hypothetical protein